MSKVKKEQTKIYKTLHRN